MPRVAIHLPFALALLVPTAAVVAVAQSPAVPLADTINRPTRGAASVEPAPRPIALPNGLRGNRIEVDGRLDEDATPISSFTQKQPAEGANFFAVKMNSWIPMQDGCGLRQSTCGLRAADNPVTDGVAGSGQRA